MAQPLHQGHLPGHRVHEYSVHISCTWLNHYTRVRVYTIHMYTRVTFQVIVYTCTLYIRVTFQVIVYTCTSGSSSRSQCTRVHISCIVGTNFRGHSVHMYLYSNGMYCTVYSVHSPQLSAITLCPCDVFVRALSFIMQECASVCNARKGAFYNIMPCLLHSIIQYKKMHLGQASYIMPELWLYIYKKYI